MRPPLERDSKQLRARGSAFHPRDLGTDFETAMLQDSQLAHGPNCRQANRYYHLSRPPSAEGAGMSPRSGAQGRRGGRVISRSNLGARPPYQLGNYLGAWRAFGEFPQCAFPQSWDTQGGHMWRGGAAPPMRGGNLRRAREVSAGRARRTSNIAEARADAFFALFYRKRPAVWRSIGWPKQDVATADAVVI